MARRGARFAASFLFGELFGGAAGAAAVNGAEALMRTAKAAGVDVCFTNPGTTEMQLVGALDQVPGMRAVLGLFEGVCTGAADGYGRMARKPSLTLLHLGPGFANGIANLHNARRAFSPIVNLIGDHPTWHRDFDPPLASDIESLARPVSSWFKRSESSRELPTDAARAIAAASSLPRGSATLVVPNDCAWGEAPEPARAAAATPGRAADAQAVEAAAKAITSGEPLLLLLGGDALLEDGLLEAARLEAAGVGLIADTFVSRLDRGPHLPTVPRLPYFPEQAQAALARIRHLVVVGTRPPVAFFGYPDGVSTLAPEGCQVHVVTGPEGDAVAALDALAEAVDAPKRRARAAVAERPPRPTGALDPASLGAALAALQPEGAIVVDEAATSGFPYGAASAGCPPHSVLGLTGGAIGQGLPCATGAAVACPERPVIAFQADGSGMYTLQSLWTHAREGLDVTTLVCSNREYRILRVELARADVTRPGPKADQLTRLQDPDLDWVALGRGLGVPSAAVSTADDLGRELERAFAEPGPHLIEAKLG